MDRNWWRRHGQWGAVQIPLTTTLEVPPSCASSPLELKSRCGGCEFAARVDDLRRRCRGCGLWIWGLGLMAWGGDGGGFGIDEQDSKEECGSGSATKEGVGRVKGGQRWRGFWLRVSSRARWVEVERPIWDYAPRTLPNVSLIFLIKIITFNL